MAMVCTGCGSDVTENQKFCHECGAALDAEQPTAPIELTDDADVWPEPDAPSMLTEPPTLAAAAPLIQPLSSADDVTDAMFTIGDTASPPSSSPTTLDTMTATPTTGPTATAQMPAVFDGSDDLADYPIPRDPFQIRVVAILSLFGAIAVLMTSIANVIDIRTTRPAAGIATGPHSLADLGSDLGPAAFAGAAVMVLGGLLACFGLRWGAGLAGGAGLALAGWAGLSIGLAELPIAIAESITRTSTEEFTMRVTRDVGWWLIVGVGILGVLVFATSLRSAGTGGHSALNPLIAAVTAVASVILGFGPLIPVGNATFSDNFRSPDPNFDLPAAFFAGRLGQLVLIVVAGVVGMLIVRSYGLGLAAGAVSVAVVLWVMSLAELGSRPVGIADRNPGAATTVPHAVTSVGMVSTLTLLAVAAGVATYLLRRQPTP
jgi:hypothetical protein